MIRDVTFLSGHPLDPVAVRRDPARLLHQQRRRDGLAICEQHGEEIETNSIIRKRARVRRPTQRQQKETRHVTPVAPLAGGWALQEQYE